MPKKLPDPFKVKTPIAKAIVSYAREHELSERDAMLIFYALHEYSMAEISKVEKVNPNTLKMWARMVLRQVDAPSLQVAAVRALRGALE